MASNVTNIYPDGTRPFTKREIARCQTFSDAHCLGNIFGDGECKLQRQSPSPLIYLIVVGNAVPPLLARRLYESVLLRLIKTDSLEDTKMDVVDLD
jgi:site-specific DNA-cytosine methylase